jgi:5-methylcytosine-specific restriction endonuclease McrA
MANCVDHTFTPRSTRPHECLICHNEYNSKWMQAEYTLVRKASQEYKLSKGCEKCGYKDNVLALQYDHIIPVRTKNRTPIVRMKQFLKLLDDSNIQVLCANCHSIKTHEEGSYTLMSKRGEL